MDILKKVNWVLCGGFFVVISLQGIEFYNGLKFPVMIKQISWVVNYLGKDPYADLYTHKEIIDPYDIALRGRNHFALVHFNSVYVKPLQEIDMRVFGISQMYFVFDFTSEDSHNRAYRQALAEWQKQSCDTAIFSDLFSITSQRVVVYDKGVCADIMLKDYIRYKITN